ncbi:3-hydroxybutyryl-CoA dehydrogenase [Streptomyces sp. Ag82_O1-12]|jgi:3-hydroxybutyryl-CoA dehydrogenase|uniref:3-hydroxyacyl-CoA dehydrogenase family protein n=1 Tax=unclassified Streptomyces TaxID=2593676 RepID=UPI000BD0715B|nr:MULTISPECIES: 3-hydroxyacyl-CoA dehydrogenase family protein [unclassified Streptomyces]SMQ18909.1 3-hydroxybutyryl-CoA dehydrogenase [Streptomyces sp. Ag82_O1-12]SOD47949.1 3-hydroxyacyl-CoA dehydrogenase [Streptomyces sp. Ag82_G6-1]
MTVTSQIRRVAVLGAGTMGIGGAHAFAAAGLSVVLVDTTDAALSRARDLIGENARLYAMLDRDLGRSTPEEILSRIEFRTGLDGLADADFVVENVTENWDIKAALYREMDAVAPEHCVFGVNTSAIPITRMASVTGRADRVVGTHLMNPVPLKKLVEVIRGFHTSPETIEITRGLFRTAGQDIVVVEDSSGFVTNRVAMLSVNEAILLLQDNVAQARDIDRLFRQCLGHQMGPLETADLIGLDTVMYSLEVLLDNFNDPKFAPAPLLRKLVAAGCHGRKSGQGFYSYEPVETGKKAGA